MTDQVSLRLQDLDDNDQALTLTDVAVRRANGRVAPGEVQKLFEALMLPLPGRIDNRLASLEKAGLVSRVAGRGPVWGVTPRGRHRIEGIFTASDRVLLEHELSAVGSSTVGHTIHPVIPPTLAPPGILRPILQFIDRFPFDENVFGMTRFPSEPDVDPLKTAIKVARAACAAEGMRLVLASDESIVDDLWSNVMAHMWASRYGIAFFEDRKKKGVNHNMTIEVGGMLVAGRRCALLKDVSIDDMPTDLVGHIYKPVDLAKVATVRRAVSAWITNDIRSAA